MMVLGANWRLANGKSPATVIEEKSRDATCMIIIGVSPLRRLRRRYILPPDSPSSCVIVLLGNVAFLWYRWIKR